MSNDRYFCSCTFVIRTGHWSPSTAPCGTAGHWLPSLYSAWSTIRRCCWCCPHESVRPPWFYWMSARYPSCCWSHAAPRFNYIAPRRLFNWPTDGLLHSSIPMWCEKGTDPFSRQINNSTRYSVMVDGWGAEGGIGLNSEGDQFGTGCTLSIVYGATSPDVRLINNL